MKPKLLVIVGPTASGKTSLSIHLAQEFNGEIISADSRQVYRGLDLGTGKVTKDEMQGVPHHLLDVANPHDAYTATDFIRDGRKAVTEITARGKLPIVVGGTFFYVDALLGRVTPPDIPPNESLRTALELKSTDELFSILREKDPVRADAIDKDNKRRLIRALEIVEAVGSVPKVKSESLYDTLIFGLTISKEQLRTNIVARLENRLQRGMIEEVENLHTHGLSYERMQELGIEYRYIAEYLQDKISLEEMSELIVTKSLQYAKRQMTWLKRDKSIIWKDSDDISAIEKVITEFLN